MVRSMLQFIKESATGFHAVKNVADILEKEGYVNLKEEAWSLQLGGKYYVTRNGSSLMAFRVPEAAPTGFMLAASHSDSPCLRLRDDPELPGSYLRLSAERYGGMIHASWVDRPLSIAGRVVVKSGNRVEQRLVDFKKDMVLIPNVAIHLNREMNSGTKYDANTDLVPLYGAGSAKGSFCRELAQLADCREEDILATDLYVYNNQSGSVWGAEDAFVSAPRLDDLACVYTTLQGFLMAKQARNIPVLGIFDNEEIGSETRQGAGSMFLPDTLQAIAEALGADYRKLLTASFMLSCDNGHGLHPNHPELADRTQAPILGQGIIIKHSPRYTTDGISTAVFTQICEKAHVPLQHYCNRPDQLGGATLGNIANTKAGMMSADIGMAQLAMHSSFETAGCADVGYMIRAIQAMYETALTVESESIVME